MTFDSVSNRTVLQDPDNGLTTWTYDSQNRITAIANPFAELTTVTWDALDREQHKVLANAMNVNHTFDAAGRETLLENRTALGVGLAVFTNSYDPIGNRLTVAELDGTLCTFGYDSTYQLTLEQRSGANAYNTSYVYDPLGNRLKKFDSGALTASQYNAANELILIAPPSGPPTTSTFDATGNLALQNTGGALTSYSWDPENRLLTVSDNTGITTCTYSNDGLRQKKVIGTDTTNFLWDEQNVLQERDGTLARLAQYTDFPGYWGGLVSQRRSTTSSFHGFDSQSSTRILASVGDVVSDSYSFKAFGEELVSGSGTINPHTYIGVFGYYRDVTRRQYVRARELDVLNGRWSNRDPLGYRDNDRNLYLYAANNPVILTDPTGLDPLCVTNDPKQICAALGLWQPGDLGGTVCCDNKPYACTHTPPDWPAFMTRCVQDHEDCHLIDPSRVGCPQGLGPICRGANYPLFYSIFSECTCNSVERDCLVRQKDSCAKEVDPVACAIQYDQRIRELNDQIPAICSRALRFCPWFPLRFGFSPCLIIRGIGSGDIHVPWPPKKPQ